MSGLRKAKKYDWKDSNMALFGSDTEKQVKKESAESEPAWQGCGQSVGLQIWRIVKFKVESWPKEDYGEFFEGDSYIVLNTYKEEDELKYDVHFWIGKYSTQDEYGTAAYKTVELDTFLDDMPVQHREVQGHESSLFTSYFKTIQTKKGGADTGFRHVTPEEYTPRLLKFSNEKISKNEKKVVKMTEVNRSRANLHSADVFIMDQGLNLIQWNGKDCNKMETFTAAQFIQEIKGKRGGKPTTTIYEEDDLSEGHSFYDLFVEDEDDDADAVPEGDPVLMKVSDADGSLDNELIKEGSISRDDLGSDDVYIIDTKKDKTGVFVWIGKGASVDERKNGMSYAHHYLSGTDSPFLAITVVSEGRESSSFKNNVPGCA